MNSTSLLRPLYTFPGWVIKDINLNSEIAVVKIRKDNRYSLKCPVCSKRKPRENRRVWQSVRDLPLGPAMTVMISKFGASIAAQFQSFFSVKLTEMPKQPTDLCTTYQRCAAICRLIRYQSSSQYPKAPQDVGIKEY